MAIPTFLEQEMRAISGLLQAGRFDAAHTRLQTVVQANPSFIEALRLLAGTQRETTVQIWNDRHTAARDVALHFFIEGYRDAYIAELDAFVAALENDAPMSPDFADGIAALQLAQAAQRSLATGRSVTVGA